MKCEACQQETLLPFRCPHCGGQFCSAHRLPENHACPRIDAARTQRQEQVMTNQAYGSYNYSYVYGQDPYKRKNRISTSPKELKHIGNRCRTCHRHRFFNRIIWVFYLLLELCYNGYFCWFNDCIFFGS